MTNLESIRSLATYWKCRPHYPDEFIEGLLDLKIEVFLAELNSNIRIGELTLLDDSWWDKNSTLYRAYKFIEGTDTWIVFISRWPFFLTSMLEDNVEIIDHPAVISASVKCGFRYVPNCLLSHCPPEEHIHTSWRSVLFSEV